jgi:hypothetical protein
LVLNLGSPPTFAFGSIGVKKKCNIQAFAPIIESISKNYKEIVDVMCKIKDA